MFRLHLWLFPLCICLRILRAAGHGCQPAPGLPCALRFQEGGTSSKARAEHAARMRGRTCNSKRALENLVCAFTPSLRGAKRRSNPDCHRGDILDCFTALAMTGLREPPLKSIARMLRSRLVRRLEARRPAEPSAPGQDVARRSSRQLRRRFNASLRGAKRRSNPDCHRGEILDCFAALAMTGLREPSPFPGPIAGPVFCRAEPCARPSPLIARLRSED